MQQGEKAAAMARDPVPRFRSWLLEQQHATEAQLAAMEAQIENDIDAAVEFALTSSNPSLDELRRDVFAEEIPA
jgi:pyruvate dehydrogenase E1 component alpha subunit